MSFHDSTREGPRPVIGRFCPDTHNLACITTIITLRNSQDALNPIVPLQSMEYGVCGDRLITYPKPYSIYFRGIINPSVNSRAGGGGGDRHA